MRRFVVHRHDVAPGEVHFDLMIEAGETLATVQLDRAPERASTPGRRSFDHRRRYLDYEGPISGDRGAVAIWDRGSLVDVVGTPRDGRYEAEFAGERLRGRFALVEGLAEAVELRRVEP